MSGFSAVMPGVDLASHARRLTRTRAAVIAGSAPPERPRALVARSWSRALGLGLDPEGANPRADVGAAELERRRRESPLSAVIDEFSTLIASYTDAAHCLLVVTDAHGVILWQAGRGRIRLRADDLGFVEGAPWTETQVGTNAIGTAIAEAAPVQLFAAEHFEREQTPWYCTAAPVHDPRTGELLGVVDVSGPALTLHPMVAGLVGSAVRVAEMQLWQNHRDHLERLRTAAAPHLAGVDGPVLLVDDDGWVAHSVGIRQRDRVEAPRVGQVLTVPGLGVCMPEPLAGGWLVRPVGTDTGIHLCLDVSGPPLIEVRDGAAFWSRPLTTRHAEILLVLLLRGPRTATDLSRDLYGDGDHAVTARAEVSRLRKVLGGVVTAQPYRIAADVTLSVEFGEVERLAESLFVRYSKAPGLREVTRARIRPDSAG